MKDKLLNRSRGTGFVRFYRQNSFEKALREGGEGRNDVIMDGRTLLITNAVDKKTAEDYVKQRKMETRKERGVDRRNLYLGITILNQDDVFSNFND